MDVLCYLHIHTYKLYIIKYIVHNEHVKMFDSKVEQLALEASNVASELCVVVAEACELNVNVREDLGHLSKLSLAPLSSAADALATATMAEKVCTYN